MGIAILQSRQGLADPSVQALLRRLRAGALTAAGEGALDVPGIVRAILADVAGRGDEAVVSQTALIDRVVLTAQTLRVPAEQIEQAHKQADRVFLDLVRRAADNIRAYQQHIRIQAPPPLRRGGRELGVRYTPVDRAGVYVPGARAFYPSTVLMTVIPAQAAGVRQVAIATPPRADLGGRPNPLVLAVAAELGVSEIYRVGGAIAVAALAFGTASIPAVDKIVGPGNAFVAEAKRQVLGRVGIDSMAGPSEVLILADDSARADWLAADLLAQAEHNPGSAILVTPSAELAKAVASAAEAQLGALDRRDSIAQALEAYSAIIVTADLSQAVQVANAFATEHLQIIVRDEQRVLAEIRHAGAIFIGPYTPVPLGDYYAGPSHVLPTGGTARFFGPLNVNDFLKASSIVRYDEAGLKQDAQDVIDFATAEGLTAHAAAVKARLGHL